MINSNITTSNTAGDVCPRCKGHKLIYVDYGHEPCPRCKGTGRIAAPEPTPAQPEAEANPWRVDMERPPDGKLVECEWADGFDLAYMERGGWYRGKRPVLSDPPRAWRYRVEPSSVSASRPAPAGRTLPPCPVCGEVPRPVSEEEADAAAQRLRAWLDKKQSPSPVAECPVCWETNPECTPGDCVEDRGRAIAESSARTEGADEAFEAWEEYWATLARDNKRCNTPSDYFRAGYTAKDAALRELVETWEDEAGKSKVVIDYDGSLTEHDRTYQSAVLRCSRMHAEQLKALLTAQEASTEGK